VAALLLIAKQLKTTAKNNNYIFIAFSGEEKGLFGSKHFADHPTIDMSKVSYMLNMDMVGRLNEEKVLAVSGAGTSPVWKDALAKTQIGNWRYDVLEAGYKYNMTDIAAAMGLVEIQRYESDMLVKRKHIFDRYAEAFSKYSWAINPTYETENKKSSYHVFMLRIKGASEVRRDQIIDGIFKRDVSVNVHFIPVPMMSYYSKQGHSIGDAPNAFMNYAHEISLPVYYDLTDEQVDTVISAVVDSVNEVFKK